MDTRTSDNWQKKPGGWDSLNLMLLQSDDDYPEVFCGKLPVSMLADVVNINDRKKHHKDSVLCSFIDDYHLERFWNQPERYGNRWLELKIGAVMTPDYSLYIGMPLPMMQWNTYRTRMLGNLWMAMGLKVIPTVTWADYRTFDFCFQGIKQGSCVAVSDIGIRSVQERSSFDAGYQKMQDVIRPSQILFMSQEKTRHLYQEDKVVFLDSFFSKRKKTWAAEEKTNKRTNGELFLDSPQGRNKLHNRLPHQQHRQPNLNRVDR
jgi:hypothetical protein